LRNTPRGIITNLDEPLPADFADDGCRAAHDLCSLFEQVGVRRGNPMPMRIVDTAIVMRDCE
jgi:hypothetical protein